MKRIEELNLSRLEPVSCLPPDFSVPGTGEYTPGGELGFRLEQAVRRIEEQLPYSQEYLLSQISGEEGQWSNFPRFHGDITGRWILAETTAHSSAASPPEHLDLIVRKAVALQNGDGSFGKISHQDNPLNMHKMYGNGWMLRGLTQFAAVFGDARVRDAAVKLGEYYKRNFDLWAGFGLSELETGFYAVTRSCYFHAFDGLVALYRLTADDSYLELAGSFIPHLTPLEESDHSHMFLTIRRGLIEYYAEKGQKDLIGKLADELKVVWDQFILETGGVPERFRDEGGAAGCDEGCSLFDWQLICLRLHQLTGETFWMDAAILNLENQIYYNQCYNGGFGSFELGGDYKQYGKEAPWCCSLFGPWGLAKTGSFLVEKDGGRVHVHHMVSGLWRFTDGSSLTLDFQPGKRRLIIRKRGKDIRDLSLYLPPWIDGGERDGNGRILLSLEEEETIFSFEYKLWCAEPGRSPRAVTPESGREVNLFYGPYMLTQRTPEIPVVDLDSYEGAQWLKGLNFYGEGYRICLKSNLDKSPNDVFLGVRENPDDLYFYCLKDKESPACNKPGVKVK